MTTLSDSARRLLEDQVFATIATVGADGFPQQTVVWVTVDGDDVLVSTRRGRRKELNLQTDPRVGLLVIDPRDTQKFVAIRGTATMTEDGGPELIQALSQKYTGGPYTSDGPDAVRVVVRIHAERVYEQ